MSASSSVLPVRKTAAVSKQKQRTLKRSISISGVGLFLGEQATVRLSPAEADTGILFQRLDLAHKPFLPATLDYVQGTPRCTIIGNSKMGSEGILVQTVEHLLSALRAYQIDNLLVEVTGPEIPILDGSALGFCNLIEEAGISYQKEEKEFWPLQKPLFWSKGDVHLVALPSDEYRVSYTLHYPHSPFLRSQYYSFCVEESRFKEEIAPCRTFSLYEEIAPLIEKGMLKGGTLENAILIKDNAVVNPEGLRFADEMVRHKILDLIGDLSLVAIPFLAHIIAIRSGHASNVAFARELLNHIKMESS